MNEEQFRYMRLIRKQLGGLRMDLNNLQLKCNDNSLGEAEEYLVSALSDITEGDWLV